MSIARQARLMLRGHRYGALATLSKKFNGHPFSSIIPYLADHDGSLLILVSALAEHSKNIVLDSRVSLITHDQRDPLIQAQGRVTMVGNARTEDDREQTGQRYLRYFPEAVTYFGMHDFSFYRIVPVAIRYIAGFGKIHWVDMESYAVAQAGLFAQQEAVLLAELNAQRRDTLRQMLRQQHGVGVLDVQAIGVDCDGLDVRCDGETWRLDFPEVAPSPSLILAT